MTVSQKQRKKYIDFSINMATNQSYNKNIASSLRQVARTRGDQPGIVEAATGIRYTFAELERKSDHYAYYLTAEGVSAGDRVMLMVKPSANFICFAFALFKLGATVILIDPGMGYKNLLRCVANVSPKIFIGIPKAHLFLRIFKKHFATIEHTFCCGNSFGVFGKDITRFVCHHNDEYPLYTPGKDDLAAILFTTGSTGPPKGVRYEHSIFAAQLKHIRDYYGIRPGDVDQPAFPLFALFSTALGACAIIPDMDATKPAQVDPRKFVQTLINHNVTYSFGSPALWNVVSTYCLEKDIRLSTLKKVLMAGAPVSGELIEKTQRILPADAEIHTPYGATESLPIVSIEGREIVKETWKKTQEGGGTCVGRPLPGIKLGIITISDVAIPQMEATMFLREGEIGEIVVSGNVVTTAYDNNAYETELAKTTFNAALYHRMGDVGYLDAEGRLWFCGRRAHRVKTKHGTLFSEQCEAIVNNHPDIYRSALVGVSSTSGCQLPVLVLEKMKNCRRAKKEILSEVEEIVRQSTFTKDIHHFLFHHDFPVDIRHNAKIFREKLAPWAEKKLKFK